uniref:Uncharacterized protein n=1 Tax=Siphoviridae sp. ctM6i4 TaxID=2827852 RepID=A0A8S5T3L9_9CAUD|nr:MAG TPA: hypothetical protein [Siphoviridae sp. ctM6i4]
MQFQSRSNQSISVAMHCISPQVISRLFQSVSSQIHSVASPVIATPLRFQVVAFPCHSGACHLVSVVCNSSAFPCFSQPNNSFAELRISSAYPCLSVLAPCKASRGLSNACMSEISR